MLTLIASGISTGGASSSSSKSEAISREDETKIVISHLNDSPPSSNTEQEKKDSNKISLDEELQIELAKSFSKLDEIKNRVNNSSRFKKEILAKERKENQTQTEFEHIQERLREASEKLDELNRANQRAQSTIDLGRFSEEELDEKSEQQLTAELTTDSKGKGKALSEEELDEEP